ncbi:MAG: UvrB/UvrC motif-containing protein [Planctomycetota bacterium]
MQCQHCTRDATIHEVVLVDGEMVEHHFCEACAIENGMQIHPQAPISALSASPSSTPAARQSRTNPSGCPGCGLTWENFRTAGHVGCEACYESFGERLSPLIERAHDGATHHVGKTPARAAAENRELAGDAETIGARITGLRKQLDDALRGEQYERAAILRDELDGLLHGEHDGPGVSDPTTKPLNAPRAEPPTEPGGGEA